MPSVRKRGSAVETFDRLATRMAEEDAHFDADGTRERADVVVDRSSPAPDLEASFMGLVDVHPDKLR
jgi:hypothetical protein